MVRREFCQFHPKVLRSNEVQDLPEDEKDEGPPPPLHNEHFWQGWKISYRMQTPEKQDYKDLQRRLGRKLTAYSKTLKQIPSRLRSKTLAEMKVAHERLKRGKAKK